MCHSLPEGVGKKSGAAEEARDHCFRVNEERVFRAQPKRAAAISADTRDGHETLRLLLPPPRILCASTGRNPHLPSWEPVQPTTARVLWSRDNFPGRTHGAPQAVAMSYCPLLPQACPAFHTPPDPKPNPRSRANKEENRKFLPAASGVAD